VARRRGSPLRAAIVQSGATEAEESTFAYPHRRGTRAARTRAHELPVQPTLSLSLDIPWRFDKRTFSSR